MRSFWIVLLVLITITIATDKTNNEYANDVIASALNGYAAIIDRIDKIYNIMTNSNPKTERDEFLQQNRRKIERELLRNADNPNEEEIINELLTEYDASQINIKQNIYSSSKKQRKKKDDYRIPIIDEIFGFNEEEEPFDSIYHKQSENNNNPQYEYIRRRLTEEEHEEIICDNNNNNNNTYKYDTDYKFMFEPFSNCNINQQQNHTLLNTSDDITIISIINESILYSPNCEFMLVLNGISGELQVIGSQQTFPIWTSGDTAINEININSSIISLQFDANNGDLSVLNGDNNIIWTASNTSHWNSDTEKEWMSPYHVTLSDNLGELYIIDSNDEIKWYSQNYGKTINFRENVYTVNLTDSDGNILYSMLMELHLITHNKQHFHLYFQYVLPSDTNITDDIDKYINIMLNMEYKFNVTVYELSSDNIGDQYIIYDPDLPMFSTLINGKTSGRLSISESHTFLCIDNQTRYFNVEVIPFNYNISIQTDDNNYTLSIYPTINNDDDTEYIYHGNNDNNYTFFIDPWNPCNEGRPVLAENKNRECFIKYDLNEVISEYNKYSSNTAYSNVNMKYIFKSSQCVNNILNTSMIGNETVVFPTNFSIESCEEYIIEIIEFDETTNSTIIRETVNEYFNSTYCNILRTECTGYYDICLDFTQSLCTCYCPRDKKGVNCEEYRDYNCKLNILNANMTECELMTQEELNEHGRSDYDVTMDGDKPCFFINDDEESFIESIVQLHCYFIDTDSSSKAWEELVDYVIYTDNITFDYCLGNETSLFALTSLPPISILRLKIFNFARIFSDDETYRIPLDINHWSGDKYVHHNKSMKTLKKDYKIGGRIYIEYQLWQMDKFGNKQNRINVERRFYDIDHWQMPPSMNDKFDSSQKWFIVITTIIIIIFIVYCIWKCNKWCKKLEHEKTD